MCVSLDGQARCRAPEQQPCPSQTASPSPARHWSTGTFPRSRRSRGSGRSWPSGRRMSTSSARCSASRRRCPTWQARLRSPSRRPRERAAASTFLGSSSRSCAVSARSRTSGGCSTGRPGPTTTSCSTTWPVLRSRRGRYRRTSAGSPGSSSYRAPVPRPAPRPRHAAAGCRRPPEGRLRAARAQHRRVHDGRLLGRDPVTRAAAADAADQLFG